MPRCAAGLRVAQCAEFAVLDRGHSRIGDQTLRVPLDGECDRVDPCIIAARRTVGVLCHTRAAPASRASPAPTRAFFRSLPPAPVAAAVD